MPDRVLRARWALPLAMALAAALAPSAGADDVVTELRVLGPDGELEAGTSYVTGTERIKTDPDAKCFIDGEGGSGEKVKLPGPTALGLLETAGDTNPDTNPLSVTDEFGFGLGICGIGEVAADTSNYWALTVNHQSPQVGGDQLALEDGDEVLWALVEFPPPAELQLTAAPGTTPGSLEVNVVRWVCSTDFPPPDPVCTSEPAANATVAGGAAPVQTDAGGDATVSLPSGGDYTLQATRGGDLDSNPADVCVSATAGECPPSDAPRGRTIVGRAGDDEFAATGGWDEVRSRGGDDRIRLRAGTDRVNCGGGLDRVVLDPDGEDSIAGSCERVRTLEG